MFKLKPNSSPASLHWKCHSVDKPKQMHSKRHTSYPGIMVPSAPLARQGNNLWCLPMTGGVPKGPGGEGTHRGLEDKAWCQGLRWPTIARELLTPLAQHRHHLQTCPKPTPTHGLKAHQWSPAASQPASGAKKNRRTTAAEPGHSLFLITAASQHWDLALTDDESVHLGSVQLSELNTCCLLHTDRFLHRVYEE